MSTLFYGLNTAKNALQAQTAMLNVTAHNIANAETPGYSRQTAMLSSIAGVTSGGLRTSSIMSIGNGVEVSEIARSRFALYDSIYRNENQDYNYYVRTEELMHQVELLFDEPSERGLSQVINNFFNGWAEVANEPQNMAARQSLSSYGEELSDRMHRTYTQLQVMRDDIDQEISNIPERINEITREVADLNVSIRVAENRGASAHDLRDKRDELVDRLSDYVDVRAIEQSDGTYTVIVGSQVLVERDNVSALTTSSLAIGEEGTLKTVIRSDAGLEYKPEYGRMGALMKFRDVYLKDIMDQLDVLAGSIIQGINYEHRYGYGLDGTTGVNFFDPAKTKAFNMNVSTEIRENVEKIAASGDGSIGDNSNALRINDVKNQKVVDNKYTINEYYNAMVINIGITASESQAGRMNEELLLSQIDNAREGIKGVSIDDELIQMIVSQRMYQGASRLIAVLDTLLEAIIRLK